MKIVDRKTFLVLPAGTLFAKFSACCFGELQIKGETIPKAGDFFYQDTASTWEKGCTGSDVWAHRRMDAAGPEMELDFEIQARDGCFDEAQLFSVWSSADVVAFILRLKTALLDANSGDGAA